MSAHGAITSRARDPRRADRARYRRMGKRLSRGESGVAVPDRISTFRCTACGASRFRPAPRQRAPCGVLPLLDLRRCPTRRLASPVDSTRNSRRSPRRWRGGDADVLRALRRRLESPGDRCGIAPVPIRLESARAAPRQRDSGPPDHPSSRDRPRPASSASSSAL